MAVQFTQDSQIIGTHFAYSPIVVGVIPSGFPVNSTFCLVHLDVQVTYNGETTTIPFKDNGENGIPTLFSIESAVRALKEKLVWNPSDQLGSNGVFSIPLAAYSVKAYQSYMLDGVYYELSPMNSDTAYAIMGGISDMDRFFNPEFREISAQWSLSKKPSGEFELCIDGMRYVTDARHDAASHVILMTRKTMSKATPSTTLGERKQYTVEPREGLCVMAFVNSLGVMETVVAHSKESLLTEIASERYMQIGTPSWKAQKTITGKKSGGRSVLAMSSGMCNRDWMDWWTNEFLRAEKYWILLKNTWIPCYVEASDDKLTIYDRSKQEALHADFDVYLGAEGSIINTI